MQCVERMCVQLKGISAIVNLLCSANPASNPIGQCHNTCAVAGLC
jgi:hypothetical protein